jgi:UTP--glucose-1-phosphate uridylyltransferase
MPKGKVHELDAFVEKPHPKDAPSNLTVVGGYVLTPKFIVELSRRGESLTTDEHDALRLADVFRAMIARGEKVCGWQFTGLRLDCGTLEGFYEAERILKEREGHQTPRGRTEHRYRKI